MSNQDFAYVAWPEDYRYAYVEQMDPRVAFIPDGRRAVIFLTLTDGQKVALVTTLDDLDRAVAQIHADPATKLHMISGGKA